MESGEQFGISLGEQSKSIYEIRKIMKIFLGNTGT